MGAHTLIDLHPEPLFFQRDYNLAWVEHSELEGQVPAGDALPCHGRAGPQAPWLERVGIGSFATRAHAVKSTEVLRFRDIGISVHSTLADKGIMPGFSACEQDRLGFRVNYNYNR